MHTLWLKHVFKANNSALTKRKYRRAQQAREVVNLLNDAVLPRISQLFLSVIVPTSEHTSRYSGHQNNVILCWHRKPKLSASLWNLNASTLWAPHKTHCFHNYSGGGIHRKWWGPWRVCLCFLKAANAVIFHSGSIQAAHYMADIHKPCSFVTPAHLAKSVKGIGEFVNTNSDQMHRRQWIMH